MIFFKSKKFLIGAILFIITIGTIALFDRTLAVGVILLGFLIVITLLVLSRSRIKSRELFLLFLIVFLVHFGAVLFIHYADFQPFSSGTGDYTRYQASAEEIAQRIRGGNFSLEGAWVPHYYPVILGYVYALTLPAMFIGQLLNVWVAILAVLLLYFIIREVGVSHKWAFITGCIASVYPSHVFFTSLLLKDGIVVTLALAGLLVMLKLLKGFSWKIFFPTFFLFYGILLVLINFRFYIGFVLLITFVFSWFFFASSSIKKRIIYTIIIIPMLGFAPQLFGYGYYGLDTIRSYLDPERITFYKEVVYKSASDGLTGEEEIGVGSSINMRTGFENPGSFIWNYTQSFVYIVLGPFPWQLGYKRQILTLFETVPWLILFLFIAKGVIYSAINRRIAIPLLVFSLGAFSILALYFSNYGIITRIRMPAFFALLPFLAIYFDSKTKKGKTSDSYKKRNGRLFFLQRNFFGVWLYFIILYLRIRARAWNVFFTYFNKKQRWFKRTINQNIMLLDNWDKGISRELLYSGIRESKSTKFIQTFLNPGDICIDIGANIGYYALQEARLVGDSGSVLAIEPSRENIELLKRNVEANPYKNITVYRTAVGSKNHMGKINLSLSANQHSFLKTNQHFSGETEEVEIVTLDTFLKDKPYPQFVRMDVEGYEKEVIRGMKGLLSQNKPLKIFMELHTLFLDDYGHEILTTLRDAGFTMKAVFKERYSMLEREHKFIVSLYDFVFCKRFYSLNDSLDNYDVSIDDFIERLPELKENVFEVFFERK